MQNFKKVISVSCLLLLICTTTAALSQQLPLATPINVPQSDKSSADSVLKDGQLSNARIIVGEGVCRTLRRSVYQRNGFIEVEVDRPYSKQCTFGKIALVVGGEVIQEPHSMSATIQRNSQGSYFWDEPRGTFFYKFDKSITAAQLSDPAFRFGLAQIACSKNGNCLTDASFLQTGLNVENLIQEQEIRTTLGKGNYDQKLRLYQSKKDARLLEALLVEADTDVKVNRVLDIYRVQTDSRALVLAGKIARENKTVDNLMPVYAVTKERELLKLAYDVATNDEERAKVELPLLQSIQDKIFDFKVSMSGTGNTKSSDTNAFIARIIETNVISNIKYSGKLKTEIYKPNFDYAVNAVINLKVKGKVNGERNCGLLWMGTCEIKDEIATRGYSYPLTMTFTRANGYNTSGSKDVDWKSVSGGTGIASGYTMGGAAVFKATGDFDISINVISIASAK